MPDTLSLLAPVSGLLVPLEQVPDPAFAQKLAGDGVSIEPLSDRLVAPCDGRVLQVHRAAHAVTLDARGLELVLHVGIDTVNLKGQGFRPLVKAGDQVRAGDPLIAFDADLVARRARSLLTQMLVSNMDRVASMTPRTGRVAAGRDVVLEVVLAGGSAEGMQAAAAKRAGGDAVASAPIVVRTETGLHARPAAVLASAARKFSADARIVKGDREANVRSVVSIMALEVMKGDSITIVARGDDAREAVAELVRVIETDLADGHAAPATAQVPATVLGASHRSPPPADGSFRGVSASPGVAVGQVYHLRHEEVIPERHAADPNQERRALDAAVAAAHLQLEALQSRLAAEADTDKAAIFAAHQELLEDPEVLDRAAAEIRGGASAAWAWRQAYGAQADRLRALGSELLAARATDMRDVGRRVLALLVGQEGAPQEVPAESIVVAEDLTPSDTASLDRTRVRGFCTTMGSATSHVAILARGLGIPAVAGIDPRVLDLPVGTRVMLDGDAGVLRPAPSEAEERMIAERRAADDRRRATELAAAAEPAVTRDGHRVEVVANIGDVKEAQRVPEVGGEGVGLLRTEFVFMEARAMPTEDEQAKIYESIARALGPERILVIRTLDVGGDKPLPYLPMPAEANPFLGERGVRLTLNRPDLFRAQVRAVLRASRAGRVAVMFPMIATLAEWRAAKALVEREREALGVPPIEVGIMVETAAAALMADKFAAEADFFSIGTNDLTQYTLAMDRTNPRLAPQVDALHPAVLRLIERTTAGARLHGRWTGVCGALAGDLAAVPVLIGLGVDELSADVPIVPAVKARVRTLSLAECRETARLALEAEDGDEVRRIVGERHG
ncbi:MAG: phosphoenolpyruvate--protein phosphotransferase [Gemmatimonadaceae bacterium]